MAQCTDPVDSCGNLIPDPACEVEGYENGLGPGINHVVLMKWLNVPVEGTLNPEIWIFVDGYKGYRIATGLDGDNLDIRLTVSGREMQHSNTSDMIFSCRYLVSYLSRCMTLLPGSIIMTGTPSGVGMGRTPQVFLKPGDEMGVEIEGIGQLNNVVEREA